MSNETEYKDLMVDRYPFMGETPYLIDYFAIIGYDYECIKNNIAVKIKEKKSPNEIDKVLNMYQYQEEFRPSVLCGVPNMNSTGLDIIENEIVNQIFPQNPMIYYNPEKMIDLEVCPTNIIGLKAEEPINCQYTYAYIFYEFFKEEGIFIYVPKVFLFVSHYPYFMVFQSIAMQIRSLFLNKIRIIPIEILLYNIVNFTPAPISRHLILNLFDMRSQDALIKDGIVWKGKALDTSGTNSNNSSMNKGNNSSLDLSNSFLDKSGDKITVDKDYRDIIRDYVNYSNYSYKNGNNIIQFNKLNIANLKNSLIPVKQLSGYPIYNINAAEILKIFTPAQLIEIMIFCLVEDNVLFFSKNLEILKAVMYIVSYFSYPLVFSYYCWDISAYSKYKLGDVYSTICKGSYMSMAGINCSYDSSLDEMILKEYVGSETPLYLVDIDNRDCFLFERDEKIDQSSLQLQQYIRDVTGDETYTDNGCFFCEAVHKLMASVDLVRQKVLKNFKKEKDNPKFFSSSPFSTQWTIELQESFYKFMIAFITPLYKMNYLKSIDDDLTKKGDNSINEEKGNSFYLNISEDDSVYSQGEALMHNKIKFHLKHEMIKTFLKTFTSECPSLKIPMVFFEEFLYLKKISSNDIKWELNFFSIMDTFFARATNLDGIPITIDFLDFYNYYFSSLSKEYKHLQYSSKNLITKIWQGKESLFYRCCELDEKILRKYSYFISSLYDDKGNEKLRSYFPISFAMLDKNRIIKVRQRDIASSIERTVIDSKVAKPVHIVTCSMLLAIGLSSELDELKSNVSSVIEMMMSQKFLMRKYIATLLSIIYRRMEYKDRVGFYKSANEYYEIDTFYTFIGYLRSREILPDEQLMEIIRLFTSFEYKKKISREKLLIDSSSHSDIKHELKLTVHHNPKHMHMDDVEDMVLEFASTGGFDNVINPECDKCDRCLEPLIELKLTEINAKRQTPVLSPLRLYNKLINYMVDFYSNLNFKKEQIESLCYLFINIIYYYSKMDYFEGASVNYFLSCISKYITISSSKK